MPSFKEDQVMMIAVGSHTTLAQLGLPESYTPAALRVPSRMFPGPNKGEWEPFKVRAKGAKTSSPVTTADGQPQPTAGATNGDDAEPELYEDWDTDEGAVYPVVKGRIVNYSCFFALISYVYNKLSPQMHIQTPVCFIAQPCWTERDHEQITQFFFEKFRTPAFLILDAATAAQYGSAVEHCCIIDVGYSKVDITAVQGFVPVKVGRVIGLSGCSGQTMTDILYEKLQAKGFTRDMCEQLKKNPICEILPYGLPLPGQGAGQLGGAANPAAFASTGATGSGPGHHASNVARGPGPNTEVGEEGTANGDDEGVLDVASIVTANPDKMQELLKRKEQEKAEKASRKKGGADGKSKDAPKEVRLLNSQKEKAVFVYEDLDSQTAPPNKDSDVKDKTPAAALASIDISDSKLTTDAAPAVQPLEVQTNGQSGPTGAADQKPANKREVEVGTERFEVASGGLVDRLADAVFRAVAQASHEHRSAIWNNLLLIGNGSKVRGFREALMASLQRRYLISPSSATMFTSEIPSNITTPMGTGAQTPVPVSLQNPFPGQMPLGSGGVNPLLLAATTASNPMLQQQANAIGQMISAAPLHASPGQVPTSIKWASDLDYFPLWKEHGFEEVIFLGAQVASKQTFVQPPAGEKTYLSRAEYNELGPIGIHLVTV